MPHGLVIGEDRRIAEWAYATFNRHRAPYDRVLGIVDPNGVLVGAIILHNFNGANIELSYYGPNTVSVGIVRSVARVILTEFNASRVTVVTPKRNKHLISSIQKLGWKLEGAQRCYYGHKDCRRNTGVRFAMFREQIEYLARLLPSPQAQQG